MARKANKNFEFINLKTLTHYEEDDNDFDGDYYDIELFDSKGKKIKIFGDYYHDKGEFVLDGFIKGIEYSTGKKAKIKNKNIADR